ncbi:MAG TPA: hypothetical protein VIV54_18950 [Burkholderiales bacterium]
MSLLWRNKQLRIGLAPDRIFVTGAKSIDIPAADGGWGPAVDVLPSVLSGKQGEAAIVLADQLVRYALLPWNETLKSAQQWAALASHRFNTLHGPRAAEWQITVTETAPVGPRLACAVDRALIAQLSAIFVKANLRLSSVQPFLVAAFNRIRKSVGNGSCWIVVEEAGRLTLALIQRGMWIAIRSRRSDKTWRNVLPEILERESAFLGLSTPVTRVIVCAQGDFDVEMHDAWRAEALGYRELALAGE